MPVVLVGGGPDTVTDPAVVAPFLAALTSAAKRPRVAYVLFDHAGSGAAFLPQYVGLLAAADHEVVPVWAGPDVQVDPAVFAAVDAVVVAGGPTPGYHASLTPSFGAIRTLVHGGGSYLGFSAGAMIAPEHALLGGHRRWGVGVCPEEWGEGLEELTVVEGLGLYPHPVEVHVGQAGTLGVLVALAQDGEHENLLGIDEDASVVVEPDGAWTLHGRGAVWSVQAEGDHVAVRRHVL